MNPSISTSQRLWRQGDVIIGECREIPADWEPSKSKIIAKGEATGHAHRVSGCRGAVLFRPSFRSNPGRPGLLYLRVPAAGCVVTHHEHGAIPLGEGCYAIWRQRECNPLTGTARLMGD